MAACASPTPPQENPFGDEAAYGEEFLAGYLAALEAVATEEAADSDGQS